MKHCRPERRSGRSTNVCERMDEPSCLPAEVLCRVQREKTWHSGRRGCILSPYQGQNGKLGLNFGSGSSVMLALAAYNLGPTQVRRAVRKMEDPIRQRNFWHLYRVRVLPVETRQYVPKIVAAIIMGRNPQRFGF